MRFTPITAGSPSGPSIRLSPTAPKIAPGMVASAMYQGSRSSKVRAERVRMLRHSPFG